MQELNFVKEERLRLQNIYFKDIKAVWTELEGEEAEKKARAVMNKHKNKDKFLEHLQARLEACVEDMEYYNTRMK